LITFLFSNRPFLLMVFSGEIETGDSENNLQTCDLPEMIVERVSQ
jgi:hypothetical protein